jgi:hypothetical protein
MASSSFGKWYDEQKQQQQQGGGGGGGGSSGGSSGLVSSLNLNGITSSLFSTSVGGGSDQQQGNDSSNDDIESQSASLLGDMNASLSSMRSTLESQLPSKIMGMNYQQRLQVFVVALLVSALFFALAFIVGLPLITVRPQKFALSFTMGSITFMSSFAILKGPYEHFKTLMSGDRLHFTAVYIGSMILTIYLTFTAGGMEGYVLVLGASGMQLVALVWYLVTFLPG